jgi:hypothetical protein
MQIAAGAERCTPSVCPTPLPTLVRGCSKAAWLLCTDRNSERYLHIAAIASKRASQEQTLERSRGTSQEDTKREWKSSRSEILIYTRSNATMYPY